MDSGGTPNLASTPGASRTASSMVLTMVTWSSTSWAMSLSLVDTSTSSPAFLPSSARVPMTSSASTPPTSSTGKPSARTSAWMDWSWARSSMGIGARFALYCGYRSSRNVLPLASKITAASSG